MFTAHFRFFAVAIIFALASFQGERLLAQDPFEGQTALDFDGSTGQMAQIGTHAAFNTYPLTVSAWVRTSNSDPNASGIVSKYVDGSLSGWSMHLVNGRLRGWYFMSGSRYVWDGALGMDGGFVADGRWRHIVMTVDPAGGKLFVDGLQTASRAWTGIPGATVTLASLQIGRYSNYTTSFDGQIDEISIWQVSKNAADLRRAPLAGNETGLNAYWKANEGAGTSLENSTAASRTATLSGGVGWSPSDLIFGSHVAVSIPGIGDSGVQDIIASDAANADPGYNREGVQAAASVGFFRPSTGPVESIDFEVALRLTGLSGEAIPLASGGDEVVVAVPVVFASGSVATVFKNVTAVLTPEVQLPANTFMRVEAIVRRAHIGRPGAFLEQARRSNAGFGYWHFTNIDSADAADNLQAAIGTNIPQRVVIGQRLPVEVSATLRRYDAFSSATPASKTFDVTFTPRLIDLTDDTEIPLTGGARTLPVDLAEFVEGAPRSPSMASSAPTLLLETASAFPPDHSYRVAVDASWVEADGVTRTVTATSTDGPLVVISGKLFFDGIETTITRLGGVPVDLGDGTYRLSVAAAHITGHPTHTFTGNPVVTFDPATRDATVTSANIAVSGPAVDRAVAANIAFRRGPITLTAAGASAEVIVTLPAGFGVALRADSRRLRGKLEATSSLAQSLAPAGVVGFGNVEEPDFYAVIERLPHRFQTADIDWDVTAGVFEFVPSASFYEREAELAGIEIVAGVLQNPSAAERFSNEGYHRAANVRPGGVVRVSADAARRARVDVKMDIKADRGFTAHFPERLVTSWTQPGALEYANGEIDPVNSRIEGVGGTVLTYAQGCASAPICIAMAATSNASVNFTPTDGRWKFTPDGGLRADGATDVGGANVDLKWGAKKVGAATDFTHRVNGFANGTALIAGHVLPGTATLPAAVMAGEKPCALLFSGFSAPGNPALVERPLSPEYAQGFADYPGINFRVGTNGAFTGRSYIGDRPFGPYGVKGISKYYVRAAGVSGIHDVITADVLPAPQVYGYDLTLDGLRLSYRDSMNVESTTAGSISLPHPSGIDVAFSRLRLTCLGELLTADLKNPGTKTLSYWGVAIQPKLMEFRGPQDANGCPKPGPRFLTLGVIGSMPAITDAPLFAALGIRPNGRLVTAGSEGAEGTGLDSRFTMPPLITIKGDNGGTYPLTVATKAALNDFEAGATAAPVGFVSFAGSLNVPFFEDLKVHLHANPAGAAGSLVHIMGGWPSDAKRGAGFGWQDAAGKHFFNDQNFDAANRGWPANVSLENYRNNPDRENPLYHPRARKVWPDVLAAGDALEYALEWQPARRAFKGFKGDRDSLLILSVDHQVQDLTSTGCSITFGAELGTPRLNASDLIAGRLNPGSGVAAALAGVVDVNALVSGIGDLDRFTTDRVGRLLDVPIDAALTGVAAQLRASLASQYALTNSFAFCADPNALNGSSASLNSSLGGIMGSGGQMAGELDTALARAIAACDAALSLTGTQGSRGKIATTARQLGAIGGQDPGDVSAFVAQAEAALAEAQKVLAGTRQQLVTLRNGLGAGGALQVELKAALDSSVSSSSTAALRKVCAYFATEPNNNAAYFAEHSQAEVERVIRRLLKDALFGEVFAQRIQSVLRARFADVREQFRAALDLALGEVNRVLNKAVGDTFGTAFTELAGKTNADPNATDGAGVGDFMAAAKIDGYAQIDGERIAEVRVNAKLQMKVPDNFEIDGFFRILNTDANTPNTSCRPPGAVKTEVTVGAHGKGVFGVLPVEASIAGKFSFGSGNNLTGLDGSLDLHSKMQIKTISLERAALKFGFGSGEAYISARVAGKVDFAAADVFAFFGRTRNPAAFDLIDQDTRKLLTAPVVAGDCFATPLTGFYTGAEVTVSINEFFRIPDSCLLSLRGTIGNASFSFVKGSSIVTGYRVLLGIEGELLCIVHVRGAVAYALSVEIPIPLDGNFLATFEGLTLSGTGRLSVSAEIGICPFCVDFSKDFIVFATISPGGGATLEFD